MLAELSAGQNYGPDLEVINGLWELDLHSQDDTLLLYAQARTFFQTAASNWDDAVNIAFGARYAPDSHWAISAQWDNDLSTFGGAPRGTTFSLQLRYRF